MILPLRLEQLAFSAGGREIIAPLSLEIEAGMSTVILGANGAGKSVLMRLMHGLLAPTSGRATWHESDAQLVRRQQAMVFQRPIMLRRSALANVLYGLELAGLHRRERELRVPGGAQTQAERQRSRQRDPAAPGGYDGHACILYHSEA